MKDYGFDRGLGMKVFLLFEAFQTTLIRFQSAAQFAVAFLKYCCLLHGSDTFVSSFKGICRTISGARKSYNRSFFFAWTIRKLNKWLEQLLSGYGVSALYSTRCKVSSWHSHQAAHPPVTPVLRESDTLL